MKRILIVGDCLSTLKEYLEAHEFDYIVLKDKRLTKFADKKFKRRVVCDFSSRDAILTTVDSIKKPIDGVLATYENYILPAAWISDHLGLPGLPVASAEACTDKFIMRSLFEQAPEKISPGFAVVNNEEEVLAFAKAHSFPLILKPTNLAKSLLVTKSHNIEELQANYRETMSQIANVYQRYAPHRAPKLLIEEFLVGSIHSVDAFVDSDGTPHVLNEIVDYQTGYDIGFDDNFHYSRLLPSKLSPEQQKQLRHCASIGVQALGMKNTPAHIEIIMTPEGPRIVEIGARNGGYRERMHRLAHDIDITGAALALCTGQNLSITAQKNEPCAVLELFPRYEGTFVGIAHETELRALDSLYYMAKKPTVGQTVGKAANGYKMCAVVILHNANSAQFAADLAFVNEHVQVLTDS